MRVGPLSEFSGADVRRILDPLADAVVVVGAFVVLGNAVRALPAPVAVALDESGAWVRDEWSVTVGLALAITTSLAVLGITRVTGLRRLLAATFLTVGAAGLALTAGALDLVALWSGLALAMLAGPLAVICADRREVAAEHALKTLATGALAATVLALALAALASLAGTTHLLELGLYLERFPDAAPLAWTAVRAAAVAIALVAAWAPFHFGLAELWGEGSSPLAGWLAVVWPWAGWTVLVRLGGGLAPAFEEWGFDVTAAVSLFLILGALLPGAAALAETRAGRLLALLAIGNLSELLLTVHTGGPDVPAASLGLWGHTLAMVVSVAALAAVRRRADGDDIDALRGAGHRLPRTGFALAAAALLWTGLPGSFTLMARWSLWQGAARPESGADAALGAGTSGVAGFDAGLVAVIVVTAGALLRLVAAGRLLRTLYFEPPDDRPFRPIAARVRLRWVVVFLVALAVELFLGLARGPWTGYLSAERVLVGG